MRVLPRSRADVALGASALLVGTLGLVTMLGAAAGATTGAITNRITISNFEFLKMTLKLSPGSLIKVTNKDAVVHTLSSIHHRFNTGNIGQNQTKSFRAPLKAGTYAYICGIHQFMTGSIVEK